MSNRTENTKNTGFKAKNEKNLFFSGVLVLTLSNILVKVIGAFLKVPLASASLLGNEGIGYYQAAYEVYVWFYTVSTVGLPVAVSIMISGSRAKGHFVDAKRMFKVIFRIFLVIGVAGTALMAGFAKQFAASYEQPIEWCILAIAPTLLLVCISSAYRGYFQGHQNMTPTAVSEVIEAVGKLALGIIFALYAKKEGYELHIVAAYALIGLSIGTALGMLYLFVTKLMFNERAYNASIDVVPDNDYRTPTREIIKTLLMIGIPITISSSVMSFTNVIDGMILSNRLQGLGYTSKEAATMFGNYKALAVTMFNLPPALIYPISASIVPLLSAAVSGKKEKLVNDTMNSSLKIAAIISLPCAFGLSALSKPLLSLLFEEGPVEMAHPLLSILAPSIFFLSMLSITNSFLQSHKYQYLPIISMVAGAVIKLLTSYILIGTKGVEMYGAPIGTFLCYLTTMMFNFFFVARKIGYVPNILKLFVKPFAAALLCAGAAYASYYYVSVFSGIVKTVLSVMIAVVVYLAAIIIFKALEKEDILLLPKGEKIYAMMHKMRIV